MITEMVLIVPFSNFSNAKLKRMFSRMICVKNDWCNQLNQRNFYTLPQIGEEGPKIDEFDVNESTNYWINDRVRKFLQESQLPREMSAFELLVCG